MKYIPKTLVLTFPNLHIKDGDIIKSNPVMRTDVPTISGPLRGCSRFTATSRVKVNLLPLMLESIPLLVISINTVDGTCRGVEHQFPALNAILLRP